MLAYPIYRLDTRSNTFKRVRGLPHSLVLACRITIAIAGTVAFTALLLALYIALPA